MSGPGYGSGVAAGKDIRYVIEGLADGDAVRSLTVWSTGSMVVATRTGEVAGSVTTAVDWLTAR